MIATMTVKERPSCGWTSKLTNIAVSQAGFSDGLLIFTALTLAGGRFNAFHALPKTPHILLP